MVVWHADADRTGNPASQESSVGQPARQGRLQSLRVRRWQDESASGCWCWWCAAGCCDHQVVRAAGQCSPAALLLLLLAGRLGGRRGSHGTCLGRGRSRARPRATAGCAGIGPAVARCRPGPRAGGRGRRMRALALALAAVAAPVAVAAPCRLVPATAVAIPATGPLARGTAAPAAPRGAVATLWLQGRAGCRGGPPSECLGGAEAHLPAQGHRCFGRPAGSRTGGRAPSPGCGRRGRPAGAGPSGPQVQDRQVALLCQARSWPSAPGPHP